MFFNAEYAEGIHAEVAEPPMNYLPAIPRTVKNLIVVHPFIYLTSANMPHTMSQRPLRAFRSAYSAVKKKLRGSYGLSDCAPTRENCDP